jgi:hypothetical protein
MPLQTDTATPDAENNTDAGAPDAGTPDTTADAGDTADTGPAPLVVPNGKAWNTSAQLNTMYATNNVAGSSKFTPQCAYTDQVTTKATDPANAAAQAFTPSLFLDAANSPIFVSAFGLIPPADANKAAEPATLKNGDLLLMKYKTDSLKDSGVAIWNGQDDAGNDVQIKCEQANPAANIADDNCTLSVVVSTSYFATYRYPQTFPGAIQPACPVNP